MAQPFLTDSSISKSGRVMEEKELVPWECTEDNAEDFELNSTSSKGWDVNDMFKQNEEIYGIISNFDQELSTYTTPLLPSNSEDLKDAEAKASTIAREIESNPASQVRLDIEDCEEDTYAAVIRPNAEPRTINTSRNSSSAVLTKPANASKTKPLLEPTLTLNSSENTCDGCPVEKLLVPTSRTYISGTNIHTNKKAFSRQKYCKTFKRNYLPTTQEEFEAEGNTSIVLNSGTNCGDKKNSLSLQDCKIFKEKSEPCFYDMPTDLKRTSPQTSVTTSGVMINAPGIRSRVNDKKFQSNFSLPNNCNEKSQAPVKMASLILTNSHVSNCNTEVDVAPSVVRSQPNSSNALKSTLNPDAAPFVPREESHKPPLLSTPPPPLMNCIPEYLQVNQPVIKIIPPVLTTPSFPSSVPQQPQPPFFYLGSPNYFPYQLPLPCCIPTQNSAQPTSVISGPACSKNSDLLQKPGDELVSHSVQTEPKKMDHRHYSQRWL